MDKKIIIDREQSNDGQSVFLYYDDVIGGYLAFGLSAFYVDHVVSPRLAYSDEMQMPVAILTRQEVLELRQAMKIQEHVHHSYYKLQARGFMGREGYDEWYRMENRSK